MKPANVLLAALLIFCCQLFPTTVSAQNNRQISGTVTTQDGLPLAGANVTLKGDTKGVTADDDGKFTISIPPGKRTLEVSFIGYITKEISIDNEKEIAVRLTADQSELSNVVVIGYGTAKKSDLTGSVVSVRAEELKAVPATTLDQALQGRAAGVQVTQISGKPGSETSIRIRGTSSINAGNEPLYVIDGLLISSDGGDVAAGGTRGPRISPLSSINPSDIESIEILKDASATAIYGSRGANGVVLITTKRGKSGKGTLTFESYYAQQRVANKLDLLNAAEFADLVNDAKINANQTPVYVNPPNLGKGTDWQDELFRNAPMANYQLSFSGGDDKTKYNISGSFFDQKGIIENSNFKRYTFRANLDRKVTDKLSVGASFNYSKLNSKGVLTNGGQIVPGVVTSAILFNPVQQVYDSTEKGGYTFENDRGKVLGNPIAEAKEYSSTTFLSRVLGNFYAQYNFNANFSFKTTFGIDAFTNEENAFGPNFLKRTQASEGEASLGRSSGLTWLNENTFNFNKTLNSRHSISALAGFTMQQFNNDKVFLYAFGFPDNRTGYYNIFSALRPQKPANSQSEWSMVSYLARANYTLDNKYLFTLTGRIDGSSKFSQNNQYGFFPSAAFAWRVSEENFMQEIGSINDLKFRVSYGVIGNQSIAPYQSLSLVGPYGEGLFNSGGSESEVYTGQEPLTYANKNLKWETTNQFDVGFDLSMFKSRISLTFDYYKKKTFDLLLQTPISYTTGFSSTLLNIGNVENHGIDIDLRTKNLTGELEWTTGFNFSLNRNTVTNLNADTDIPLTVGGLILREGEPVGTFFGYHFDGIYQSDAEAAAGPKLFNSSTPSRAGDRKYRDTDKNGVIDVEDREIIGYANPKFTFGLNNSFRFKNIELSFFIQGAYKNYLANLNNIDLLNFNGQNNVLAEAALNRWSPENPSAKYPRALSSGNNDQGVLSTAIIEDASYLRLKNITVGYNLPAHVISKLKMSNLRVYASATNLWTLTDYTGYDPEANTFGQDTNLIGIDLGGYPQAKVLQIGLSASF